jgi:hypothetical protein
MATLIRQTALTGSPGHQAMSRQADVGLSEDVIREGERVSADPPWPAWQVLLGVILFCGVFWTGLFYVLSAVFG